MDISAGFYNEITPPIDALFHLKQFISIKVTTLYVANVMASAPPFSKA